ncbi:hypothetical protein PPSIR1_23124 [Plesiocystis pacifica SIR-1]|uniref:CN hydrolase domain-containing protein n=1 Tax=Plesiocystis pacifica SIR-1 TaxID=391625 RepID=A6GKJ0_9BACT|nr:SUMF1/EgtB/PvdO family nonheme iron enzyme [Plesiocystis pacifica]EDM73616.1 hypothetical protein PPSIR1_23124 [Plesiocystis pacifica SIR-1]
MKRLVPALALVSLLACRRDPEQGSPSESVETSWRTLPKGSTWLGAPPDDPCQRGEPEPRRWTLDHGLAVSATEVTQAQFARVMGFDPSYHQGCPGCPVDSVTFDEAAAYCNALTREASLDPCYRCELSDAADGVLCQTVRAPEACTGFRLPTREEWEYLARAGSPTPTHAGTITACMGRDEVSDRIAWYKANSSGWTHPVAQLEANPWGLFDTSGNVYEWVDEGGEPRRDFGLLRGGSWYHNAEHTRAASELRVPHERRLAYAGFRVVRTLGAASGPPLPLADHRDEEPPTLPSPSSYRPSAATVAAIAFTHAEPSELVPGCADENCVIERLIREAAKAGAALIVTPEYALAQFEAETCPDVGDEPADDPNERPLLARFAELADEVDAYVVINLETIDPASDARYNTVVALDPEGAVAGTHHKFELYGGERDALTPGGAVSTFDTPFGRVGLLTCADIYGRPHLHEELVNGLDARIVAWSAEWTVDDARRWQAAFAHDWKVFLVAANGARGVGRGAGVYGPDGEDLERLDARWPILYARLPGDMVADAAGLDTP